MSTESVQLIFQIRAENQAILTSLRGQMAGVNAETEKGVKLTTDLSKSNLNLVVNLKLVAQAEGDAVKQRKASNESLTEGILKGVLYAEGLRRIISLTREATVDSAVYAARTQQLNVVMDQLARVNGLSVNAVRAQADAVKAQGITTQESRETINKMIFAQLDLTKATDLARLAQNAAKIAGISSSEALQGIIAGVVEQRVQMLRTYGIQVSFEQALIRGAAALHKNKDELTDYQRANIALNEVLSKSPRIAGAYEVSLSTAAGQMQSLKRHVDEAKNALGEGFLPVLQKTIDLLTDGTRSVEDNADAYQALATHVTSAGVAFAVFKATKNPALAAATGVATELFAATDNAEEAKRITEDAARKVAKERADIAKQFATATLDDKQNLIRQDEALKKIQLTIEENFTEQLARIYKKRREQGPTINDQLVQIKRDPLGAIFSPTDSDYNLSRNIRQIPEKTTLGDSVITRAQIEAAIAEIGKPIAPGGNLKITPDAAAEFDAILGQFTEKAKEALKTSQGGLARSNQGLLFGADKIEAERKAAIAAVAEQFRIFNSTFKETLAKADTIKDPEDRKRVIDGVRAAQGQYGNIIGNINRTYDLQLEKDKRDDQIDIINRTKREIDAQRGISGAGIQASNANRLRIAGASQRSPGNEEEAINKSYRESLVAARQRNTEAQAQAAADLDAAQKVSDLNKDDKKLDDAKSTKRIADLHAQAQLTLETNAADTERQVQILELRKKQRQELQASLDLVREELASQSRVANSRARDASARGVKLSQARANASGDGIYGQNLGFSDALAAAQAQHADTQTSLDAQERQARLAFASNGNGTDLERAIADIRKQALQADYELEKSMLDLRMEKELQIVDIRKQQDQELRSLLGELYGDLGSKGGGLGKFFRDQFENFKKQVFVNTGAIVFKGVLQTLGDVIPGQQQIDPVTGKPNGKLTPTGQILKGTVLGIDPGKLAAAQQLDATNTNTKALQDLTNVLLGRPASTGGGSTPSTFPRAGGSTNGGGLGGILGGIVNGIGGVLKGASGGDGYGGYGGSIIRNFSGGGGGSFNSASPVSGDSISIGNLLNSSTTQRFAAEVAASGGNTNGPSYFGKVSGGKGIGGGSALSQIGAAASALPGIIGGIQEGGFKGITGAVGSALGAAASIPGPQQPFIAGAAMLLGIISGFSKSRYQTWQDNLNNRLASKFHIPSGISLSQDLAGNSVDYDYLGNQRSYSGGPSTNNTPNGHTINIHALDMQSFASAGPMLAHSIKNMIEVGHPLAQTIKDLPSGS